MATQLTVVNNVLKRLREDTVLSVADSAYAQLIATFVNDGIQDTYEAYDWSSAIHTIEVTVAIGQSTYDISALVSGGGNVENTGRITNSDSMLRFDSCGRALCFLYDDAADDDANYQLTLITEDDRLRRTRLDRDQSNVDPNMFSLRLQDDGEGYVLNIWPEPEAARQLLITFATPPPELEIDGTDDATVLSVPPKVVEAYAHMMAANERGEEIGEPGNLLEQRWQKFLGGAIEAAMSVDARADRYLSYRD